MQHDKEQYTKFLKALNDQQLKQMEIYMQVQKDITVLKVEMSQTKKQMQKFQELYITVVEVKYKLKDIIENTSDTKPKDDKSELKQRYKDSATGGGIVGGIIAIVIALFEYFGK